MTITDDVAFPVLVGWFDHEGFTEWVCLSCFPPILTATISKDAEGIGGVLCPGYSVFYDT